MMSWPFCRLTQSAGEAEMSSIPLGACSTAWNDCGVSEELVTVIVHVTGEPMVTTGGVQVFFTESGFFTGSCEHCFLHSGSHSFGFLHAAKHFFMHSSCPPPPLPPLHSLM
jgi:hypothetical protein